MGGILTTQDHNRGYLLHGEADQGYREKANANRKQRHDEQRNDNHGDHRPAIAQRIDQFLAIDDPHIAQTHGSTTFTKRSSRSWMPNRARSSGRVPSVS